MGMAPTLALLVAALGVAGLAHWRALQPVRLGKVRMISWPLVQILAAAIAMLMLVHVVNLLGVHTGRP